MTLALADRGTLPRAAPMTPPAALRGFRIQKISAGHAVELNDQLAVEAPLELRISAGGAPKNVSITLRTPGHDPDWAFGFLFSEGIIRRAEEVTRIDSDGTRVDVTLGEGLTPNFTPLERNSYTSTSCGACGKSSLAGLRIELPNKKVSTLARLPASLIPGLPARLRERQAGFEQTGGMHASALFDLEGKLLLLREDVGRHNALDKVIGAALRAGLLPLNRHILLLSGRISFELVQKAALAGIQLIVAIGAPSSLAVELAEEHSVTLIGFLRGETFNIYCGEERILRN